MATKTKKNNGNKSRQRKPGTVGALIIDLAKGHITEEEFQTALNKHYKDTNKKDKPAEWVDVHVKGYIREARQRKKLKKFEQ